MMLWHHFGNAEDKIRVTILSFVVHERQKKFCNLEAFELIDCIRITMENICLTLVFVLQQILLIDFVVAVFLFLHDHHVDNNQKVIVAVQLMLWYVAHNNCMEMEQIQQILVIIITTIKQIMWPKDDLIQQQAIVTAADTHMIQRNNNNNGNDSNSNNGNTNSNRNNELNNSNNNNANNSASLLSQTSRNHQKCQVICQRQLKFFVK